jgi:hypothetical protein
MGEYLVIFLGGFATALIFQWIFLKLEQEKNK